MLISLEEDFLKKDFTHYVKLVKSISQIPPKSLPTLLKVISPKEAEYAGDDASLVGIRVKLSNGIGDKDNPSETIWPPRLVYKLVVLGPVVDQTSVLSSKCITIAPKSDNYVKNHANLNTNTDIIYTSSSKDLFINSGMGKINNSINTTDSYYQDMNQQQQLLHKSTEDESFNKKTKLFFTTVNTNNLKNVDVLSNIKDKVSEPACKEKYKRVVSEWRAFDNPEAIIDYYVHSFDYDRSKRIQKRLNKIEKKKKEWADKRKKLIELRVRTSTDQEFSDALQFAQNIVQYEEKEDISSLMSWVSCLDYESYLDEWYNIDICGYDDVNDSFYGI